MTKPVVSIVKHNDTYNSIKEALELCDGLQGFSKQDKILIKPNLVSWDFELPFPPYGVLTTSAVIFALVQILHEAGFNDLTIGEASLGSFGSTTERIFQVLGYEKLREKYGVNLIDFNKDEFEDVDVGGFNFSIARTALEVDKIINIPVLKTHNQCKVSLGIKNLKGCLHRKSKKFCHARDENLEHMFPRIAEVLPMELTIIDGIFALEKGPGHSGKAFRKDILAASRDILACDVVGAALLGYDAGEVEHIKYFAARNGGSIELPELETRGEAIADHADFLDYTWKWTEDNTMPAGFQKRGIKGLALRKYDDSLCTACAAAFNPVLLLFMSAFKGEPFPGVEFVSGKRQDASPGFEKTVLFGKCAYHRNKGNPNINKPIFIKGCPPDLKEFQKLLKEEGIHCDYEEYVKYRHYIFDRYLSKEGFDMELYVR